MKTLPADLAAHLLSGTTTLCWCWKLTRRDGVVLGFTDHDRALFLDGLSCEAASGFTASEIESSLDLSIDNLTVTGALSAASLNDSDLAAGLFDGAAIEIWRVNWASPGARVLMRKGTLGEVKRGKTGFAVEIRGLTAALNQPVGRVYSHMCDARLGDARCGVAVTPLTATISAVTSPRAFTLSGLGDAAEGWFAAGALRFTSGANRGQGGIVKRYSAGGDIVLWQAMAGAVAIGDAVEISVGCDHLFPTCRDKFSNAARFRGCPYMPGTGAVLAAAAATTPLDGKSRYGN